MRKKIVWKNPNKMIFESGYLSYDNYVDCISNGNTLARGWTSMYVRSWNTTECNGKVNPPGYLTKWDVNNTGSSLPNNIKVFILAFAEANPTVSFCWARMST